VRDKIAYVLPIKATGGEDLDDLTAYLQGLSRVAEVIVVDGSDAAGYLASLKKRLESNEGFWAKAVGLQEQR